MSDYPEAWVTAAAEALYVYESSGIGPPWHKVEDKDFWRRKARAVLDAVAPTIRAAAEQERDGYATRFGWEKRRRLLLEDGIRALADQWATAAGLFDKRYGKQSRTSIVRAHVKQLRALLDREEAQ